ncbi:uncharacterized protein AMSG_12285 [Thecamonas trahens ATCC 50062]|uniref:Autophagy-related protein 9 n=1 Tax=Thecamonas trahens ATCC 50062 TaxID=461836 RepID=A0A0L0DP86_THETB|nr:hypothetical protein AMSG_12285 [Thecamonas trahens ATCC 50062]KNC54060.1 hypothetical protein AMSG_12285 [Thecamonas trahens ATCC 50062]|eukprot:XP_013754111.1 hypothetical protein AMSG_12285 [Thecamonas trahens ATCC 50062]
MLDAEYHRVESGDMPLVDMSAGDVSGKSGGGRQPLLGSGEGGQGPSPFANIASPDGFLKQTYLYYVGLGYWPIVTQQVFDLLTLAFVIFLFGFVTMAVEYGRLLDDLSAENRIAFVDYMSFAPEKHPFALLCAILFSLYWLTSLYWFVVSLPLLGRVAAFYKAEVYEASDRGGDWNLKARPWSAVVARVSAAQRRNAMIRTVDSLDALDVTNIIMRQENFMLGLYEAHILGIHPINAGWLRWVPVEVPFLNKSYPVVTAALDYNYRHIVLNYVFSGSGGGVHPVLSSGPLSASRRARLVAGLRTQFRIGAVVNLVLMPFILVFLVFYFFFKYGEQFHSNPHSLSARAWSPYAKRIFRMYNELLHEFENRVNKAHAPAYRYLQQFPPAITATLAKFVAFLVGSATILFVVLSLIDQNAYFNLEITPDKSVVFYLGPAAAILALARSFIPAPYVTYDADKALHDVAAHTRFLPPAWEHGAGTREVLAQFSELFQYKVVLFLQELISVVLMPWLLLSASMGSTPEEVLRFFEENLVEVRGLGHLCRPARFDLDAAVTEVGAASLSDSIAALAEPGKANHDLVLNSFVNFAANHPEWVPCPSGTALLQSIASVPDLETPAGGALLQSPAASSVALAASLTTSIRRVAGEPAAVPRVARSPSVSASQQWFSLLDTQRAAIQLPHVDTRYCPPPIADAALPPPPFSSSSYDCDPPLNLGGGRDDDDDDHQVVGTSSDSSQGSPSAALSCLVPASLASLNMSFTADVAVVRSAATISGRLVIGSGATVVVHDAVLTVSGSSQVSGGVLAIQGDAGQANLDGGLMMSESGGRIEFEASDARVNAGATAAPVVVTGNLAPGGATVAVSLTPAVRDRLRDGTPMVWLTFSGELVSGSADFGVSVTIASAARSEKPTTTAFGSLLAAPAIRCSAASKQCTFGFEANGLSPSSDNNTLVILATLGTLMLSLIVAICAALAVARSKNVKVLRERVALAQANPEAYQAANKSKLLPSTPLKPKPEAAAPVDDTTDDAADDTTDDAADDFTYVTATSDSGATLGSDSGPDSGSS